MNLPRPPQHTARSYQRTHVWAVYAASYDDRRYVYADDEIDAAEEAARWYGVRIHEVIVRYRCTAARWWAPWICIELNGESHLERRYSSAR